MALFNSISASAVLTLLSCIPPAPSQNTPNEHLVLADCGIGQGPDGGSTSREAFYYSNHVWTGKGDETNSPTMVVNVPWSGQYPWTQQGGIGFTMPNGDDFAVLVKADVKDPNDAGIAAHAFESGKDLTCYSYQKDKAHMFATTLIGPTLSRASPRPSPPLGRQPLSLRKRRSGAPRMLIGLSSTTSRPHALWRQPEMPSTKTAIIATLMMSSLAYSLIV